MARPLRIEFPGAFYHVINRGQSRRDIFRKIKNGKLFSTYSPKIARLWKIKINAYCFMSTHYHLVVSTPAAALSRAMRHLDGIYTQKFNRVHHRDGPLFRGLEKASSVSSAFLPTKSRVAPEKKLARRVRRIEAALSQSKSRTRPLRLLCV